MPISFLIFYNTFFRASKIIALLGCSSSARGEFRWSIITCLIPSLVARPNFFLLFCWISWFVHIISRGKNIDVFHWWVFSRSCLFRASLNCKSLQYTSFKKFLLLCLIRIWITIESSNLLVCRSCSRRWIFLKVSEISHYTFWRVFAFSGPSDIVRQNCR